LTFETFIALRQLRSGRSGSLSVISTIAVTGVVLAVAALVTVMSVTGGFQRLFREKVLGLNAHVLVMRYGLEFDDYEEVMRRARDVEGVVGASPFVFYEMMVSAGDQLAGVMVKGIDPATADQVSDLSRYLSDPERGVRALMAGSAAGGRGVVLGSELASKLGVAVGDSVLLVSPRRGLDAARLSSRDLAPTSAPFLVVGIHSSGFYEYDARLVFVHFRALQDFFRMGDTVTGVELKVADIFRSREVARDVRVKLGDQRYSVTPWAQRQLATFERVRSKRARLRWAWLAGLVVLVVVAGTLLIPVSGRKTARALGAAILVGVAAVGAVVAWQSGWGARWLDGPQLGLTPHVRVVRDNGDFLEYRNALAEARLIDGVSRCGAFIAGRALRVGEPGAQEGPPIAVRGFDSEARTLPLRQFVVAGRIGYLVPPMLPEARMPPYRAVLGEGLARRLGVSVGDRFRVQPTEGLKGRKLPAVGPYAMEVAALVRTGDAEVDGTTLFMDFVGARRILSLVDAAEGVDVWVDDPIDAERVAAALRSRLGGHSYRTLDWKEINHNIFRSLELQKQSLSLVLFVITVVAALNIISTLVMMVIDKGHQVAILKAMGATGTAVMRIFIVEGFAIGLSGTLGGLGLGYVVCKILASIRFPLQADVYLIDYLPVDTAIGDFVLAACAALCVSLWATIYPSIRAASLTPVEGLRQR